MAFLITTTGTLGTIIFNDLGKRTFTHPTTNYDLEQEYSSDELRNSTDLGNALDLGYITAKFNGIDITSLSDLNNTIFINDNRLFTENVINVKLNPGIGEFSSIKTAIDSITDNTSSNRYYVKTGPGIFTEDTITLKPYVYLSGTNEDVTIIQVDSPNKHVIIGSINSEVSCCTLTGATGTGYAAVYHSSLTGTTNDAFHVEFVRFGNNDILVKCEAPGNDSTVFINKGMIGSNYQFNKGFIATNNGSGIGKIALQNSITTGMSTPYPTEVAIVDGLNCEFITNSVQIRCPGAGNTGIKAINGGKLRLIGLNLRGFAKGIWLPNTGAGQTLFANAVSFEDCTQDLVVENSNAVGVFNGLIDRTKSELNGSAIYIQGQDKNVINVAKLGGDYSSIVTALNSITNNTINNRYELRVGPGTYTEPLIDLKNKPYVSIIGHSNTNIIIEPDSSLHHIISLGEYTQISNLALKNAGSDYSAIYINDAEVTHDSIYNISINDCDIGVLIKSENQDTESFINGISITGNFSKGICIDSNNGYEASTHIDTIHLHAIGDSYGIYATGVEAELGIIGGELYGPGGSPLVGVGIYLQNGASCDILSTEIKHWNIGIENGNVGSGCTIIVAGSILAENEEDLSVLHPLTIGGYTGIGSRSRIFINPDNASFSISFNESGVVGGNVVTGDIYQGLRTDRLTNITKLLKSSIVTGVLTGGNLSEYGSPALQVLVEAGTGFLTDQLLNYKKEVSWNTTVLNLTNNSHNYVYVNSSSTVAVSASDPDLKYNVILGRAAVRDGSLNFIDTSSININNHANELEDYIREVIGTIFNSGSTVSESAIDRQLDVTGGHYHFGTKEYLPTGGTSITWEAFYRDGSNSWYKYSQNTASNTYYDTNTGTLTPITSGYYAKHSLYLSGEGNTERYMLIYAQAEYATLIEVESAALPLPPPFFIDSVTPIASIVVKEGTFNIIQIRDERPTFAGSSSAISAGANHGNLLGLSDDDHPQYLLTNGTRLLTGNLDLNNNNIININLVDGIDVTSHASRHLPNGSDPLTSGIPISVSTSNSIGIANSFAKSDHQHSIGTNAVSDININTHTSTKITITNKVQLNSGIIYNDQSNTFGLFEQIFRDTYLKLRNPGNTFNYIFSGSAVLADRTISLPLLTGNDTFVFQDFIQSLTNKTINGSLNTITNISLTTGVTGVLPIANGGTNASTQTTGFNNLSPLTTKGDIITHSGTNNVRLGVGTNGQAIIANSGAANGIEWGAPNLPYNSVNAAGNITTASATAVLATDMTITPGAGTYIVWFNTDLTHTTNSRSITISVYANGSLVTNSDKTVLLNNGNNDRFIATTTAIVTVSAGQAIEGRWLTSGATATMGNRILTLLKVA